MCARLGRRWARLAATGAAATSPHPQPAPARLTSPYADEADAVCPKSLAWLRRLSWLLTSNSRRAGAPMEVVPTNLLAAAGSRPHRYGAGPSARPAPPPRAGAPDAPVATWVASQLNAHGAASERGASRPPTAARLPTRAGASTPAADRPAAALHVEAEASRSARAEATRELRIFERFSPTCPGRASGHGWSPPCWPRADAARGAGCARTDGRRRRRRLRRDGAGDRS